MSSEMKTLIVFDTNILIIKDGRGVSYSSFEFNSTFDSIKKFIEFNNLSEKVVLAIPKLVIEELKQSKLYWYKMESQTLENKFLPFNRVQGASLTIPKRNPEYEKMFENFVNEYFEKLKFEMIDYPYKDCLKDIIFRAIHKKKPFIVTDKHSDYGFKDVVIWESILNYDGIKNYDKIILMTGDKKGFDDSCIDEFKTKFNKYIFIFDSQEKALEELSKDYEIILEENEYLKFAKGDYFREQLESDIINKNITINDKEFKINRCEIVSQCDSFEEEENEFQEKTGIYLIKSTIIVYYNVDGSEKKTEIIAATYIDDAKDIQKIEYEPELS